jgi:hypothetical protein
MVQDDTEDPGAFLQGDSPAGSGTRSQVDPLGVSGRSAAAGASPSLPRGGGGATPPTQ